MRHRRSIFKAPQERVHSQIEFGSRFTVCCRRFRLSLKRERIQVRDFLLLGLIRSKGASIFRLLTLILSSIEEEGRLTASDANTHRFGNEKRNRSLGTSKKMPVRLATNGHLNCKSASSYCPPWSR